LAFQALYSWDAQYSLSGDASIPDGLLDFSWAIKGDEPQEPNDEATVFSRLLVSGTVENIAQVDAMIQKHLENWSISRLNRVDLAILRMSAYAMMFQTDVPATIVIDEAVGISKEFGADDSYRFVNGVLDGIRKTLAASPQAEKNGA
ncbi:MAG: transcription antitermination factor NusB, partial [Treponema sp.]|nr:transcription antitermination factor NusB [Treponema sp.]